MMDYFESKLIEIGNDDEEEEEEEEYGYEY